MVGPPEAVGVAATLGFVVAAAAAVVAAPFGGAPPSSPLLVLVVPLGLPASRS